MVTRRNAAVASILLLVGLTFFPAYYRPNVKGLDGHQVTQLRPPWLFVAKLLDHEYRNAGPNLRVINASVAAIPNDACVTGQLYGLSFPICTYTASEDGTVSRRIQSGKYWEPTHVAKLMTELRRHPSAIFVDIGSNVGAYCLPAAHLGHQVIAVEPNIQTMRHLATSVYRGKISDRITLLNNAISNYRETLQLSIEKRNRGNSFLLPTNHCRHHAGAKGCTKNVVTAVNTIMLDDLLQVLQPLPKTPGKLKAIVKVDAQGSESKIFDQRTASKFFHEIDVKIAQIEWVLLASEHKRGPKRAQVEAMLSFFYHRNYTVHALEDHSVVGPDWTKWPYDVIMAKP